MDYRDPQFDEWLSEHEAEASRVKRMGDWRQRNATDLLLYINQARILARRAGDGAAVDASDAEALVSKIEALRKQIGK